MIGPEEADNPYLALTRSFNRDRLRCILSSGQAVVVHGVALMSKDGDWLLREDAESCRHVLHELARRGARYRFGAPLDPRWLAGGWSCHLEFPADGLRVRTDFVSRPPRIGADRLAAIWREQEGRDLPVVDIVDLARIKMTNREKDYPVIGELARLVEDPQDRLLLSRSARDLIRLTAEDQTLARKLTDDRPLLAVALDGDRPTLEAALDAERRQAMRANERRLERYLAAAGAWAAAWPVFTARTAGLDLVECHRAMVAEAESLLPARVPGTADDE